MRDLKELLGLLESRDAAERLRAAEELGDYPSFEAVSGLVSRLASDECRAVQEACLVSLCRIGTAEVGEEAARLLRSSNAYVRNAASEILQELGDKAEHVVRALLCDPDPDVRLLAVRVVGEGHFSGALPLLREVVLRDPDVNVVGSAVEYLGELGGSSQDREAICQARSRFSSPYLDFAVETALSKMGVN